MKDFDYIIIGGGCAGLSLAYELEINDKLKNKKLAIIENRDEYKRDKTWSFWGIVPHHFDDCVIKHWNDFSINIKSKTNFLKCGSTPYQSIDSNLFYKKVLNKLKDNKNVKFFKNINEINVEDAIIFNSLSDTINLSNNIWQHFGGIEIETEKNIFDESIMNLMDFNCEQKNSVHFFYTLPYSKNKALIESTWISNMSDRSEINYDEQLKQYIETNLKIKNYSIIYKENGKIPLFYPKNIKKQNTIYIGTAGGMTRLSTGYTFLNIQDHSKYICKNIEKITTIKKFELKYKYQYLDKIFLKVLSKNPEKMPEIFFNMFTGNTSKVIKFLSNKSNIFEDLSVIWKMPKLTFIKELI